MEDLLEALLTRMGLSAQSPLKPWQLYMFTLHLHAMLRCGMGLVQALDVLGGSGPEQIQHSASLLLVEVESGRKFSQALNRQPQSFPSSYIKIVETGEETGKLIDCLERLARTLDKQNLTSRRLGSALVYPSFLMVASILMVMAMVYLVFPMVVKVTQDVGVRPPALTRVLIAISQPRYFLLGLLSVGALALVVRFGLRIPVVRRLSEEFFPPAQFYVQVQILRSTRQLALMLESGVDLLRSLIHGGQVGDGSLLVREAYGEILRKTRAGESMAQCFAEQSVFPRSLPGMLAVCEETGATHTMLHRFCDMLEDSLNSQIDTATALLEPVMLAGMGVVIGIILIAAFLPIYQLVGL